MSTEQRRRRSAVLVWIVGVILALAVGVGGTMAFWSDEATVETGSLEAGRLDVTLNGQLTGPGGSIADAQFAIADLVPGESFARTITVGNGGTVPLDFSVTGSTSGTLGTALRWTVVAGGTAGNTGTIAAGDRTGTCTGGTTTYPSATISGSAASPTTVVGTRGPLAVGTAQSLCIIVGLDPNAPGTLQGETATARFVVTGTQRGAA
ncbi:hypothetical protein BHE97_02445 [Aeromicrobium sp. PE09-221]|uniref:TasA family protein n=1 Tax=Aeromicrobium sp. PE09-221 TaxID=1898043 RepID=UPI000B63DD1D|nr:TasA family protein [Aeromicrobium sp. PE09-221]OUZ12574.1 hypothetical protein BHE97_02445 [Aeromicrobium sp. PE09-221]